MNEILEIVFSLELIHLFVYFIQCLYSFKRLTDNIKIPEKTIIIILIFDIFLFLLTIYLNN